MTGASQRKTLITRYLLGQASAEECAELEDQYLRDDDMFEEIVAAENDLIDAYVRGNLAAAERTRFEVSFLSIPERRERVEFAKSLMRAGSAEKVSAARGGKPGGGWYVWQTLRPGPRWAAAIVLLAVAAGLSWMAVANRELRHQLAAARAVQADAQRQAQALRQQIADMQENRQNTDIADLPEPGSPILSVTLAPDLVRGGGRQQSTLRPPPGISEVRLLLKQNHDRYSTYAAVLETAEGRQVWSRSSLVARATREGGKVIIVKMQPSALSREDYVLRLFGTQPGAKANEIGTYSFRVVK
jgi:hypothetical protein